MARRHHYVVLLLMVFYIPGYLAQRNITVDDNDPSIIYSGQDWEVSTVSQLDVGGTHHLSTNDPNASAKFTFTGTAVYVMSPLWPYPVGTQVQLDNQTPVPLNLRDPNPNAISNSEGSETVGSAVVWSSGTIPNATHTLIMSRIPTLQFVIVDAIIYTVLDSTTPSSSPSPSPSSSSSSFSSTSSSISPSSTARGAAVSTNTPSSDSSSSNHILPIVLGTVLGAIGLLIIVIAIWLCSRGKKRPKSEAWTITGTSLHESASPPKGPLGPQHPAASQTNYDYGRQQQPQGVSSPYANDSWSSSNPKMSAVEAPLVAQPLPNPHDTSYSGPSQDFNPWTGIADPAHQRQNALHPQMLYDQQVVSDFSKSPFYAPTTLSTITERSTPGTMNSNRLPLRSSPASRPSVELGFYTPPPGTSSSGARLSYASDLPVGAAPAASPHQYLPTSPSSTLGSTKVGTGSAVTAGKLKTDKSPLVAVNRTDDETQDTKPPAYTL